MKTIVVTFIDIATVAVFCGLLFFGEGSILNNVIGNQTDVVWSYMDTLVR